jgi:hypothetical protein
MNCCEVMLTSSFKFVVYCSAGFFSNFLTCASP